MCNGHSDGSDVVSRMVGNWPGPASWTNTRKVDTGKFSGNYPVRYGNAWTCSIPLWDHSSQSKGALCRLYLSSFFPVINLL